MKKRFVAMVIVSCMIVVSPSAFALLRVQVAESTKTQREKKVLVPNTRATCLSGPQTVDSSITQASKSDPSENNNVSDPRKLGDDRTVRENELTLATSDGNRGQISGLSLPFPDGRIFLRHTPFPVADDPIPYIPTEDQKTTDRIPIALSGLDN